MLLIILDFITYSEGNIPIVLQGTGADIQSLTYLESELE